MRGRRVKRDSTVSVSHASSAVMPVASRNARQKPASSQPPTTKPVLQAIS